MDNSNMGMSGQAQRQRMARITPTSSGSNKPLPDAPSPLVEQLDTLLFLICTGYDRNTDSCNMVDLINWLNAQKIKYTLRHVNSTGSTTIKFEDIEEAAHFKLVWDCE